MPRPATGQLYPSPVKTKVTESQRASWDALMERMNLDSAKALRAVVLTLIGTDKRRRNAILTAAGLK
jgi:hypothetical protein